MHWPHLFSEISILGVFKCLEVGASVCVFPRRTFDLLRSFLTSSSAFSMSLTAFFTSLGLVSLAIVVYLGLFPVLLNGFQSKWLTSNLREAIG